VAEASSRAHGRGRITEIDDRGRGRESPHYLVLIGEAEVLPALYGSVLIPPAVVRELTQPRTPEMVRRLIAEPPDWLQVRLPLGPHPSFRRS
jgi:hypothetical protein